MEILGGWIGRDLDGVRSLGTVGWNEMLILWSALNRKQCPPGSRIPASTAATSPPVMDVLASTASILEVAVSLVVSTTTGTSDLFNSLGNLTDNITFPL